MKAAFDLIDEDGSKTVEYKELQNYYVKVNGISPNWQKKKSLNHDNSMEEQPRPISNKNFNNNPNQNIGYQQPQGYGYPQQQQQQPLNQGSFNPFSALMYGQDMNYMQQPPPPMYQQPPYNPYMYQQPPQQQSPPQQKQGDDGIFRNNIFGQLANKNQGYPYGNW